MPILKHKAAFNEALHSWYHECHRKLPWRTEASAYRTVVSEFMLQQTQVDTVLPYFERWHELFPDFQALAEASEEAVLKAWEGLGYYSRARNLHKLAKAVAPLQELPKTAKKWLPYPGIGPYTSAAIASIAFGDPSAVVDGNVIRILSRLTANTQEFKDNTTAAKNFTPLANDLLNEGDPNTHNQAVMELGATVCTKANPLCTTCPVVNFCQGAKQGIAQSIPKFVPRKIQNVEIDRLWILDDGKLLLHKNPPTAKRLANICELPDARLIVKTLNSFKLAMTKTRGISNQRIQEKIYVPKKSPTQALRNKVEANGELIWVEVENLPDVSLSGPHRRWITQALRDGGNLLTADK